MSNLLESLIEDLLDSVSQGCSTKGDPKAKQKYFREDHYDSCAISTYAVALENLEELELVKINKRLGYGRRQFAKPTGTTAETAASKLKDKIIQEYKFEKLKDMVKESMSPVPYPTREEMAEKNNEIVALKKQIEIIQNTQSDLVERIRNRIFLYGMSLGQENIFLPQCDLNTVLSIFDEEAAK